jgi:rhodanese-related sulfurtransferase
MNRFLKTNILWLSLLGLAVVIVVLAFVFRPKSPEYHSSVNETLKLINDPAKQISLQEVSGKQLIDIRSAELFALGHPGNAINIPIRQLLSEESIELLDELKGNGKQGILCGSNELEATAPWLLLQQLGYKNILIFKGGISSNGELIETETPLSEVSVVDPTAFQAKPVEIKTADTKAEKKNPESIIPIRKAASSGGGC